KRAAGWRWAAMSSPATTMSGAASPPMASTASVNFCSAVPLIAAACEEGCGALLPCARPGSGADGGLQGLASPDDLAAVIVAAMAAHVVRALQLAAVAAFGMGFAAERLVAAPHAAPRGRGLSL